MYEIYAWNTHEYAKRKIGETYKREERESIMSKSTFLFREIETCFKL